MIQLKEAGKIKITILMDNLNGGRKDLKAEHGLSLYAQTDRVRVLFDFGAGEHTYENAVRLNIRPDRTDYAVCSHGHFDHGGGYRAFVENGLTCPLVTGMGFFTEKYARMGHKAAYLGTGFDQAFLEEHKITHTECPDILSLAPDCWVMGNIRRTHDFETSPGRFVIRSQSTWMQDTFSDEICMVFKENEKLTVIVGCSHPGILNILDTVREHFKLPIRAVVGGTHLVEADRGRIEKTIAAMKSMGIRLLGFNHCSGQLFREMTEADPELDTVYLGAGDCLFLT